jgi:hypothetical protein
MPIDASIALGIKPMPLESPINQMAKMYEMQNAQQSNQLNQMKMDEYSRGVTEDTEIKNALRNLDKTSPTYEQDRFNAYALKGIEGVKAYAATKKEEAAAEEHAAGTTGKKLTNVKEASAFHRDNLWGVTDPLSAAVWVENLYKDATIGSSLDTMIPKQQMLASIPTDPTQLANWKTQVAMGSKEFAKESRAKPSNLAILQNELAALSFNDPKRAALEAAIKKESTYADTAMQEYEAAKATGFKGSFFDFKRQLAEAGRTPAQAPAPTITTVVDPTNPSRSLQVDARVYRGGGEGSAGVIGAGIKEPVVGVNLSAKTIQQREAKYPQATTALKGHLTDTDNLVKDLTALVNHPGLSEITGIVAGRLPGGSKNARAAQALYDKIVAKGGFNELQKMRDNSVTGGALGNVSDTEGKRLEASFAGLDRRQDADSVKLAAKAAINQLNASKANIQDAYDLTYEYKGATGAPSPPPGFVVK